MAKKMTTNLSVARQKAVAIIEQVIEPLLKRGISGEEYYKIEDELTELIGIRKDEYGIPEAIVLPVYYAIGENDEVIYDIDEIENALAWTITQELPEEILKN